MTRSLLALVSIGIVFTPWPIPPRPQAESLAGLWGVERTFGPAVSGTLTIDGRTDAWRAVIDGFAVAVVRDADQVRFELPDDQGAFRGRIEPAGHEVVGQWIQPPGVVHWNRYATPVVLAAAGPGVWHGEVAPLPDTLSMYLQIRPGDDGTLQAYFRNPEFNFGRGNPYVVAVADGDAADGATAGAALTLTSAGNESDVLLARRDPQRDALLLEMAPLGLTLTLTRRDSGSARGFYPRTPPTDTYAYRAPVPTTDGWDTADLTEAGLRPEPLAALVRRILTTRYDGFRTPYIHSLLIARHGKLALEEYFHGADRDETHDMRSAGKTFAGALVGLARERGAGFDLDTPVLSLFPDYPGLADADTRKRAMTVEHLLTMTSGLSCDDNDDATPGNEDVMQNQEDPDWIRYTLELPMARDPGSEPAVYCTAGINLLGGVLRGSLDAPLPEFFFDAFARPLGIRRYHLNLMPSGDAYLGGGIHMRARDQLKLGQLYLDDGVWNGQRVVPESWVRESLSPHSSFGPGHGYGLAWHLIDLQSGDQTVRLYEAGGNGGQFVLVIPSLDMVVGFTAGNYGDYRTWYAFMTELVPEYVIPAARP